MFTSRNQQKKRKEIRLMTKKRTPQHLRKRKTKLTGWSTLFQVVRTSTSRNLQKKRREIKLMTKKRTPQTPKKEKNETYRLVHAIPSRPDVYKPKSTKKRREIRLMTKKRTSQHLRKRKMKLTGWFAVCAIPRSKSKTTKKKVFFYCL